MADHHPRFTWERIFRSAAHRDLDTTAIAVGLYIATYANRSGFAEPSRVRMAQSLNVTERTISRATKALTDAGWLTRTKASTRARGNAYRLRIPHLTDASRDTSVPLEGDTHVSLEGDTHVPLSPREDQVGGGPDGPHHAEDPDEHYVVDTAMEDLERDNQWPVSVVDDHVTAHYGRPWEALTLEQKRQSLEHLSSVAENL